MRIIKWIFGLLLLIVLLVIIFVAYIAMTFDANAYKETIIQAVKEETGRNLNLDGELSMSFFPWLGATVNDASLSNAQGFAAEEFLKINKASIRLQVMPLFKKTLVADRILFSGVEVWLERDANGKANWDDITEHSEADEKAENTQQETWITGSIAGFSLENSIVHWKDVQAGQDLSLTIKRFDTGALRPDTPTSVDGEIHFELKEPATQGQLVFEGRELSLMADVINLKSLEVNARFNAESLSQEELRADMQAHSLRLDLDKDSVEIPEFTAQALGVNLNASISATQISKDSMAFTGKIRLADFSPKEIAAKLNIELPEMSDEAWTQASLNADYRATTNSVALTNMSTVIDGTEWTGKAGIDDLAGQKISFDLAAASLDANRLIPPAQAGALQDKEADAESEAAVNAIEIPIEPLKLWDAKGTLRLGTLTFANIVTTDLEAGINLLDGKLRVFPSKANFFGGQYSGDIRLDVSGATPRMQADERITGIDLGAMGKALWAESYMTGRTNGRIAFDASGKTVGAMRESAKGHVEFKVTDGMMLGFDLNYAVANALSLLSSKSLSDTGNTRQTAFETLSATAKMDNGVLQNDDFLAVMPRMRIRGKGQLNLINTGLDYQVIADILESKSATSSMDSATTVSLDELVGASIPIKVTGTLAAPTIRPDVGAYLKNKAEQEIEDKLKDKLGDLLGGGSSEPEEVAPTEPTPEKPTQEEVVPEEPALDPVEQKKQELEQKAKDKLKDIFGD